jgi:hypothetical protein
MLKKAAVWVGFAALVFAVGLLAGFVFSRTGLLKFPARFDTAVLLQRVQTLSQLVTVKYVLEKVVVLDDVKWYGDSRVILVAHGVVKAGINLEGMQPGDFAVSEAKIKIKLPRPSITDVYLDDRRTEVLERSTGVMRVFDKDLEQSARRQAVDDLRLAARENGILKDADERARAQLASLLHQMGFAEVEFSSK